MAINIQFSDEELPELQQLLNRALNTWNPSEVPEWAWKLDAIVMARINDRNRIAGAELSTEQVMKP
jgi:hypothetical protein